MLLKKKEKDSRPVTPTPLFNLFVNIDNALLKTTQGVADPMTANTNNRIGDEITFKGVSLKFILELNERYSDVTVRIMVVKSARGDTPTDATLLDGGDFRDFYHNWTNSILQQPKKKFLDNCRYIVPNFMND